MTSSKNLIIVREYNSETVDVPFTQGEISIIRSEFKDKIDVHPNFDGQHEISAQQFIGYIVLPNHNICIQPKIHAASFVNMVRYALQLPKLSQKYLEIVEERDENYYDILVRFLLQELEKILQEGILYGYRNYEDNIACIRGKILFKENLTINHSRLDKICCSFSDFSPDILENRIIKYTLFHLCHCYFLDNSLYTELINYYNRLDPIDLITIKPEVFKSIEYTSVNDRYRPILNICEMFLLDTSLDLEAIGERTTISFLINMNSLFEKFIGNLLTERLDNYVIALQEHEDIETRGKLKVRADIMISYEGKPILVLDTKYKQISNDPEHTHLAQMNMYCDAYGVSNCGLVYAGDSLESATTDLIWGPKLHTLTFDLTASKSDKFEEKCSKFIEVLKSRVLFETCR